MLKFLGYLIKISIAVALVLFGAHFLKWDGVTLSDQLRTHLSHAEPAELVGGAKGWAMSSASHFSKKAKQVKNQVSTELKGSLGNSEEITASERQRLKSLIRDLNTSRSRD